MNSASSDQQLPDILLSLNKWGNIVERNGGRIDCRAAILNGIDVLVELFASGFRSRIEALLGEEKAKLPFAIPDYGCWRSSRANPGYAEYLDARNDQSEKVRLLQTAVDTAKQLDDAIGEFLKRFFPAEGLLELSQGLRQLTADMSKQLEESVTVTTPIIDPSDVSLCLAWSGRNVPSIEGSSAPGNLSDVLGGYEACRLLSARMAEKAVAEYYQCLRYDVVDIAITQLHGSKCERWKDFDLLVDGHPLDVKNARQSFSSPDTYVQHCVPSFKFERQSGQDVSIAGVLSKYGTEAQISAGEISCRILGETNIAHVRRLHVWMRKRFGQLLNLDGLWTHGYLPGWIFEYPNEHYARRVAAIDYLEKILNQFKAEPGFPAKDIPGWLLALCPNHNLALSFDLPKPNKTILSDLHSLNDQIGFSRPTLFVYAMGILLESLRDGVASDEVGPVLKDLFFCDSASTSPLWLLDTQGYVAGLIDLLLLAYDECAQQKIRFVGFKMPHPSILIAQREDLSWMTLMAYCGGWRQAPVRVKCGASPLVFGKHTVCPSCARLICDKCGYCSDKCDLAEARQRDVANGMVFYDNDAPF